MRFPTPKSAEHTKKTFRGFTIIQSQTIIPQEKKKNVKLHDQWDGAFHWFGTYLS